MSLSDLQPTIETAWENRATEHIFTDHVRRAIDEILAALDTGSIRVAEKINQQWYVHQWIKKAILLSFIVSSNRAISGGVEGTIWYDKVTSKFLDWDQKQFAECGIRAVPNCIVRRSAYIASGVVLMPCFVNVGAYVDRGTMIDTWATVGSCAQIGQNVHLSGGAGIGGVLEPLQANPVIIEDDCFIGARCEIAEGVIIERGAVIAMGVFLSASTKIIDRATGEIIYGRVPPYSVVVPGAMTHKNVVDQAPYGRDIHLGCAVIVKQVDQRTRERTSINELLRI